MNIDEIRMARREMESAIRDATVTAMETFRARTGLCPDGISIYLANVTSLGESEGRFVVEHVRANVPL